MYKEVLSRRDFVKASAAGAGLIAAAGANSPQVRAWGDRERAETFDSASRAASGRKSYDPILDPVCHKLANPAGTSWRARWIWHPGQLASHLQAKGLRAAMRRCTSVGYPGTFRQPLTHVYLRTRATLAAPQQLKWAGPVGRIRLLVNGSEGDITARARSAGAGPVEVFVAIDFAESLPCLLLEGGPLSSGPEWEASLDRDHWVAVESEPALSDPNLLPDGDREWTIEIPPDRSAKTVKITSFDSAYQFEPGGDLVLDFRHDELGQLAFNARGSGKISIVVGESLAEVESLNTEYFEQYALPDLNLTSRSQAFLLPERCVRFARFMSTERCQMRNVRFRARVSPVEYRGDFLCSDSLLNDIWAAGAATLHACLHDFYLDGIRRDALSWHDGLMALEAGDLVFFDATAARQTIVSQSLPPSPGVRDLGIADAPLYALTAFENDYLVRGDLDFSRRYRERIHDTLRFFMSLQDEKCFVNGRNAEPYGFFPDWSAGAATGPDSHGTPAYAQMLMMRAFEIGSAFAGRWQESDAATTYAEIARKLRINIRGCFWSEEQAAYINGLDREGKPDRRLTSFSQVAAILFDLASVGEWNSLFDRVLDNASLRPANWSISQQWECLAYAKAGRVDPLLNRLRSIWGGILKQGYTRFWEDIRPADNETRQLFMYGRPFSNSLCHGWAGAAPILGLMRGLLGIWPKQGGYARCEIRPHLSTLEWLRGAVPTPAGDILLELEKSKGGNLTLPAGIKANLIGYAAEEQSGVLAGPGTFHIEPLRT